MNAVYLVFLGLALVGIECYVGGTRLLFSLPAYGFISLAAIFSIASVRRKESSPDAFCIGSTLLLGGWVLYRSWQSPVEYLALPDFFMMTGCLMVYVLTAFYLTKTADRSALIILLWAIAAVEVLVAMIQFVKDPSFMLFGLLRPTSNRPSGMYISPNNFAGFLDTVSILSISIGVWSRWRSWAKILAIYLGGFCLVGVAISGSRGGYFDAIGSLLFFAIGSIYTIRVADPRKFIPVTIAAAAGLAVVVGLAVFLMAHSQFLTYRMNSMVSKDVRLFNWEAALDHIRVSPWIGTGAGTHLIYGRLFRRPPIQADPVHAHCDYLELMAEYGAVGVACMTLFLAAHVRRGFGSFSEALRGRLMGTGLNQSNSFAIQLGALCAVGGLAIHSVVDFDMHIPANALIFAFIFGVLARADTEPESNFVNVWVTPWARLLAPALGALMLWRGIPLLPSEYCAEQSRTGIRTRAFTTSVMYARLGIGPESDPLAPPPVQKPESPLNWWLSKIGPNPKNPDLYFYLGEANRAIGERMSSSFVKRNYLGRAAKAFDAGLKVFPQDESMLVRYGEALDELREFASAEIIYQQALKWDPNLDSLHDFYEKHLIAEGKKAEAEALERARQQAKPVNVISEPTGDFRLR